MLFAQRYASLEGICSYSHRDKHARIHRHYAAIIQSAAIHVQKCRLSQRSRECHMTMVVQPRLQLVIYKIAMWVQGVRNTVTMEIQIGKADLMIPCSEVCCLALLPFCGSFSTQTLEFLCERPTTRIPSCLVPIDSEFFIE